MANTRSSSFFRKLLSMQVGLGLFSLIALISMLASFLPPSFNLYGHPVFITLLVLLVVHTGLCTFRQLPGLLKRPYTNLTQRLYHGSVWLVHLSVLCIGITGLMAALLYTSPMVSINEGESSTVSLTPELAVELSLEDITVEHYQDGMVSDWISTVEASLRHSSSAASPSPNTTPAVGTYSIKVNQPAILGDVKILQGGYQNQYAISLQMPGSSEPQRILLPQDTAIPLDNQGQLSLALSPAQAGLLANATIQAPSPDSSTAPPQLLDLIIMAGGKVMQRGAMFSTLPLELGDTGIVITVNEIRENSVFIVRYTPHLVWLWASFALLAMSICGLFIGKKG